MSRKERNRNVIRGKGVKRGRERKGEKSKKKITRKRGRN